MSLTFNTTKTHRGRVIEVLATGKLPDGTAFRRTYRYENENGFDTTMLKAHEKLSRVKAYKAFEQACAGATPTTHPGEPPCQR